MKLFQIFLLPVALLCSVVLFGQVNFVFLPEVHSRSIDGLGTFQVQNFTRERLQGQVVITVQQMTSRQPVVRITTPVTVFASGVTPFPKSLYTGSHFTFANNALARVVNQTKSFPPGSYSFCFQFEPLDKGNTDVFENCFESEVEPLLPISLLYPSDGDTICLKRPMLSWHPPMPYHSSMRFRLMLTEKRREGPTESMVKDVPLLLLDNIAAASIQYPATHPELKEGKTYYWQVVAYQQGIIISTSEVWTFTVQCREADSPVPTDSYRELKLLVNGNYYVANNYFKFSIQNPYSSSKLSYAIIDAADGGRTIRHLPEITIQPGLNKIDLDLTGLNLKPGGHYILKVYPFNQSPLEVRFVYQEKNNDH